jgi:ribonuclease HI
MQSVTIHADGACEGNGTITAVGGIGIILMGQTHYPVVVKEISAMIPPDPMNRVTNQRAELLAVITALEALNRPCEVTINSDSQYVICTMRDGWKRKANLDLWTRLDEACKTHSIRWVHVRGHVDRYNIRCDQLATGAIREGYVLPKQTVYRLAQMQNEGQS